MSDFIPFPLSLNLKDLKYLELRLKTSEQELKYFGKNKSKLVNELSLKQFKNGKIKERIVYNPSDKYKDLLRRINKHLLSKSILPEGVLGGVIASSIDTLAQIHCEQEAVLSIDFKNFFPNISSGRVFNLFKKSGCINSICEILTDLTTLNGSLPQGFPTSTMLANLVAFELDHQHLIQCKKLRLKRTRWVDDISFSGNTLTLKLHAQGLIGAVKFNNFILSNRKTSFETRPNNPVVVGLNVAGSTPRLPQIYIDKIRDILLECKHSGWHFVQENYECNVFGKRKNLQISLKSRIDRVQKYGHSEWTELMEVFRSINWGE
jgi:RNA-directed DNA polymerase